MIKPPKLNNKYYKGPWVFPSVSLAASLEYSWAFVFLLIGEAAMNCKVEINPVVAKLIEELRMMHVDVNLIIQEELEQLLPSFIEDIVRGLYMRRR